MARTIPNKNAEPKLATKNPGTMWLARIIRNALMNRIKIPRLRTVIGNVRKISIGRKKVLIIPRTIAKTRAANIPVT